MNRIDIVLTSLKAGNKKMLSPYITAGDPHPNQTVRIMHELIEAGADILELGLPFSDPMAEGPVIQQAMERALVHGITTDNVLDMVRLFREQDKNTPIILMGYLNPIEQYGYEAFAHNAVAAGVDGTILVDLPPEESHQVAQIWNKHGLYSIYLCSPTTTAERMELIGRYAKGYLYYVSLKGVSGSDALNSALVKTEYEERKRQTKLPLMVGFGIKNPQMAAEIASFSDGVIVGASLVSALMDDFKSDNTTNTGIALIRAMRHAIDSLGMN